MQKTYTEKILKGDYKQIVDIKIDLEKLKDEELKAPPKFKGKEALVNRMIEKLIVKTAERVADNCQSTYSFEVRYSANSINRKATEKSKLLEAQVERLRKELEVNRKEYEDRTEAGNRMRQEACNSRVESETQLALVTQKMGLLEKELSEKDGKWKSAASEKEAEMAKKLAEYKEKIRKLELSISEKDKETICIKAEAEKAAALAEQQLQYTSSKLQETEAKAATLQQNCAQANESLASAQQLITVQFHNDSIEIEERFGSGSERAQGADGQAEGGVRKRDKRVEGEGGGEEDREGIDGVEGGEGTAGEAVGNGARADGRQPQAVRVPQNRHGQKRY